MKYIVLLGLFLLTGYLEGHDTALLVPQMQDACHKAYWTNSNQAVQDCSALIAQIQKNNDLEVIESNGNYTVESRANWAN